MAQPESPYSVQFSVDFSERPLSRLTTLLRLLVIIPIVIVLALVSGGANVGGLEVVGGAVGGALFFAPLVMILFRRKYPRWWFDWNVALWRFENRVIAYLFLLRDEYPSTDGEQAVHLEVPYPDVERDLNRWLPLVKWLLALPHYVVLFFLVLALLLVLIISWFTILFTGRYPLELFDFAVGNMRWWNRVQAYAFLLVTDRYPPFRLGP